MKNDNDKKTCGAICGVECHNAAIKYHNDMREYVITLAKDGRICDTTKINLVDQVAFKLACVSAHMQTDVDPKIFEHYGLMLIPSARMSEVEKILDMKYANIERGIKMATEKSETH